MAISEGQQLSPSQQMCYYDGKLFGGYLTFLMNRIVDVCCRPAVTVYRPLCFGSTDSADTHEIDIDRVADFLFDGTFGLGLCLPLRSIVH